MAGMTITVHPDNSEYLRLVTNDWASQMDGSDFAIPKNAVGIVSIDDEAGTVRVTLDGVSKTVKAAGAESTRPWPEIKSIAGTDVTTNAQLVSELLRILM